MAAESPGAFNQSGSYAAEQSRRAWQFEIAGAGGVKNLNDFTMAAPGSGLSVNVGGAGGSALDEAMVPGSSTTTQGIYYGHLSSQTNVAIGTASGSNPRVDSVYAVITDSVYSGITNTFALVVVAGTPTSGASLSNLSGIGAAPVSSLLIGYVLVPTSATNIITADILNAQPYAYSYLNTFNRRNVSGSGTITAKSGDHVIVSSGNTPVTLPAPFPNARVKVTNYGSGVSVVSHNASEVIYGNGLGNSGSASFSLGTVGATATCESDGTSWWITAGSADSGWIAPSLSSWANVGAETPAGYRKIGSQVLLRGDISGGTNGSSPYSLPAGFRPPNTGYYPMQGGATTSPVAANCGISTSGSITCYFAGSPSEVSLNGILFTVD